MEHIKSIQIKQDSMPLVVGFVVNIPIKEIIMKGFSSALTGHRTLLLSYVKIKLCTSSVSLSWRIERLVVLI
jgi:hypothetical protein